MTYDHYRRTTPRLNVLRGWPGNETTSLSHSAKPKAAEAILSGMFICLDGNGEWIKATATLANHKQVYVATADQSDTDVVSSGKLLGLSCSGDYEIQTPFFKSDDTYNESNPVKLHSVAGYCAVTTWETAGDDVVGVVSPRAVENIASVNSEATPVAGEVNVLNLVLRWVPERVA